MRDIYDLIDEIEVSDEEMTEMETSEFEREKVKRNLKKSINKKKRKKRGLIAAGICALVLGGASVLGTVNPVYASQIPFLGDIFKYIDNEKTGAYDKYKENANEINVTKSDNGVSVTIKDAVFDGNTVVYTYEIESDKDLGDFAHLESDNIIEINGEEYKADTNSKSKKSENGTIVGKVEAILGNEDIIDKVNMKINIKKISCSKGYGEYAETINEFKGNWTFNISLDAVNLTEKTIDKTTEKEGIKVTIKNIAITPMSFTIKYKQELSNEILNEMNSENENMSLEDEMESSAQQMFKKNIFLKIKDNLGNEYTSNGNSSGAGEDTYIDWVDTFNELDENATELIITPYNSEITFDDIVVDLAR